VSAAGSLNPDLVLMDVQLPGIDGYTATRRLRAALPSTTVLLVSTHDVEDEQVAACGAAGFVAKAAFGPDVLEAFGGRDPG
jgi:CheY-like chemotaxis protein